MRERTRTRTHAHAHTHRRFAAFDTVERIGLRIVLPNDAAYDIQTDVECRWDPAEPQTHWYPGTDASISDAALVEIVEVLDAAGDDRDLAWLPEGLPAAIAAACADTGRVQEAVQQGSKPYNLGRGCPGTPPPGGAPHGHD
jgi:hypothetical protein